jgi:hypothetical protein
MSVHRISSSAVLILALVGATAVSLGAQNQQNQNQNRSRQEQQDIETVVKLVDGVTTGAQPAPADIPIAWESNHFVRGADGSTYVPFTLAIDASKLAAPGVALYVRVVSKDAAPAAPAPAANQQRNNNDRNRQQGPMYPWDNVYFLDVPGGGKVARAMQLKPGNYEAFIVVKERTPQQQARNAPPLKAGLLRHEMTVPDLSKNELMTSSVIVASVVEPLNAPLSPAQQQENPYTFGQMRVVPSSDARLKKSGELQLVFWVYGAANRAGKPDVQIEYNFHQKTAEGEKYFNKTAPLDLNAQTLPPQFDLNAGHQLPGIMVVPLSSFPEGDYRVEIKVNDKVGGKSITENATFSVVAG